MGPIPGLGRSPGGGNSSLLCYSCLENPTDRGAWWATVHRVTKSRTRLSTHAHTQHDACGKALLGGFSEVTAKNGSKWVPPTIPIIKTVLGQLAETQLHPWVGTPQLPPVPGPHPHHKLAWEMMALALPAAFPGDPWGPVHSTAQSGCPASCACPLPLAGLLETRPGSAASLLCQQEPGPSLRSPCPQIHLQKMARDRVRLVPSHTGQAGRACGSLVHSVLHPLGPWGNMLGRREELGTALPWRSARLQGETTWREAINPMMAELEPRGQQSGSRRLPGGGDT